MGITLSKPFAPATYIGKYFLDGIDVWSFNEGDDFRITLTGNLTATPYAFLKITAANNPQQISNDTNYGPTTQVSVDTLTGKLNTPYCVIWNDNTTEGLEKLLVSVYADALETVLLGKAYLWINDTSKSPIYTGDITVMDGGEFSVGATLLAPALSGDPDARIVFYQWIKDGSPVLSLGGNGPGTTSLNTATLGEGLYQIQLTAENSDGSIRYVNSPAVTVIPSAPSAPPPSISSITTQGLTVILKYTAAVSAQLVPTSAFTVATVSTTAALTTRIINNIALDPSDPTQVILTLDGTAPVGTVNLQVSYTDPIGNQAFGVIQDLMGNDTTSFSNAFADTFVASSTSTIASQYRHLILEGVNNINGTGNTLDNTITGNAGNNSMDGGAGADTLIGGLGNDIFVVDDIGDVVTEELDSGTDTIQSFISYTLGANLENLSLFGSSAIDGTGNIFNNTITGNAGNNSIDGGAGGDTMTGGAGNDTYVVDNIGDVVTEGLNAGTDTVKSSITSTLGANLENLTLTGATAIDGTGNALNNTIVGNADNNVLNGGAGTDTLIGGLGNDTFVIDVVGDVVMDEIDSGIDTVQAPFSYVLGANLENLILTGTSAINGTGNTLNNTMTGNAANNILNGGAGADTIIGGLGNDTYLVDDIGDVVIEQLASGTDIVQSSISYTLSNNLENLLLIGSAAMDGIGNPLNNTITGNAGNNSIDGGAGRDIMTGGAGDDTYVVDNTGDVVTEGINAGIDTVQASVTSTLGANLENLKLTGSTAINGTGNVLNNTITGNAGNNVLNGGAGADTLLGGLGNDTFVVDDIGDVVIEELGSGTDTIQSTFSYTLGANLENLSLTGSASIDGTGNSFNNTITGNAGNNSIDGGTGADKMAGGAGDDTYIVDNIGDGITETLNAGIDSVQSSTTFTLGANLENLALTGSSAINGTGNALHNIIIGNAANNILRGGAGIDVLTGLDSADIFQFALADSRLNAFDHITDLAIGTDSIDGPSIVSAANVMHFGSVSSLTQEGIAASLTPSTFLKNQAATFTFGASTYLAFNDAAPGFNSGTDGIIDITGYSGNLYSLAII